MAFPTNIESPKNTWTPGETRGNHASQHNMIANLLVAIQNTIGITGSTDPTSIKYFIANHSHSDFYTKSQVDSALATKQTTIGFAPENSANRAQPSGYASLDAGGKVPESQLNLSLIGKYLRTVLMGEALPSPGYQSSTTKNFALPGSLAGTYLVIGGRVRFDRRTKIISASWKTNAINGSAAMIIQSDAGVVLSTTAVANGTNIAPGIDYVCEPGIYYQIGVNSTANFGGRGERALTAQEIADGFVTGCYNNGNFDSTWRLEQVVYQTEVPSNVALAIVGRTVHQQNHASSAVGNIARLGVRFSVPVACKLWEVRSYINATTGTASFLLLDATGATLATGNVTNGTNTTTFGGYQLAANTEYRLVMNDTGNFGTTYYYTGVAAYQTFFSYALSGISGAGAGTVDNTNIGGPTYIELDFENKAYVARANKPSSDPQFCTIDGYASSPKSIGDSVTLNGCDGSVISGMNGLTKGQTYYLQNSGGALAPTPGTQFYPAGVARSATELEITSASFTERLIYNQTTWNAAASTIGYTQIIGAVAEGRIRYTLTANGGANSGMWLQWSETGNPTDPWVDIGVAGSGNTITDQHVYVKKGFLRGKESVPGNPAFTATFTVYQ